MDIRKAPTEDVTTDQLKIGDLVWDHAAVFRLMSVRTWKEAERVDRRTKLHRVGR